MHQQQLEKGLRLFSACCRLEAKLAQYELLYDTNPIPRVAVSAKHSDTNPIDTNPTHQQQVEKGLRLFSARCRLEAKLAQYGLHCDTNPVCKGWGIRQAQSLLGSYHNEP